MLHVTLIFKVRSKHLTSGSLNLIFISSYIGRTWTQLFLCHIHPCLILLYGIRICKIAMVVTMEKTNKKTEGTCQGMMYKGKTPNMSSIKLQCKANILRHKLLI